MATNRLPCERLPDNNGVRLSTDIKIRSNEVVETMLTFGEPACSRLAVARISQVLFCLLRSRVKLTETKSVAKLLGTRRAKPTSVNHNRKTFES